MMEKCKHSQFVPKLKEMVHYIHFFYLLFLNKPSLIPHNLQYLRLLNLL